MSDERRTPPPSEGPADEDASEQPTGAVEIYPVDRLRRKLRRRIGGRPLMVYVVLLAGAATLLLLLLIVWISAATNDDDEEQICTEIAPAEAQAAVLEGQVRRVRVLVDQDQPVETLTGIVLEYVDDACRQTPMGADQRPELFRVLGSVELYNHFTDGDGVAIAYTAQDIQRELLATSTPTAAPTDTPAATIAPASPTAAVVVILGTATAPTATTETATEAVTETATAEPSAVGTAPPGDGGSPTTGAPSSSPSATP